MVALDRALPLFGLVHDVPDQHREDGDERDQQAGEPPVQDDREGQEHDQGDESGAMRAEEAEPQPGHAVGALQHHLEHAAGMGLRMEGDGQVQHMLEIVRHHRKPPAVRQPVGMERHEHARADGEQAEADPQEDQRRDLFEGDGLPRRALRREHVDDLAEQRRLREGGDGEQHVGDGEKQPEPQFGPQQPEHAAIEREERHAQPIPDLRAGSATRVGTRRLDGPLRSRRLNVGRMESGRSARDCGFQDRRADQRSTRISRVTSTSDSSALAT